MGFIIHFLRKITGYYDLLEISKMQDNIIYRFKLLCKKNKETANNSLGMNSYKNGELYRVGLRKIITDIDYELDLPEKEPEILVDDNN